MDFTATAIDEVTGNKAHVCKRFYASTTCIAKELGLNNNSSPTDTSNKINNSPANNTIVDKNIADLKIRFGIGNIPIENHQLPNVWWIYQVHKSPIRLDI